MRAGQLLKRALWGTVGLLVFYPFLVALVCWLLTLWQTYVVLFVVSVVCYWKLRRRFGVRGVRTQPRAFLERVPYEPTLGPIAPGTDDWEP